MGYTVLLVDDSRTIRNVLTQTFEMTKIPLDGIHQAGDGIEALKVMDEEWVDIIFCDINMPRMNGLELVEKMRNHPEFKAIPIVIVSTEGSKTRIRQLKELGVADYLRKPCRPEEIREIIHKYLGDWEND